MFETMWNEHAIEHDIVIKYKLILQPFILHTQSTNRLHELEMQK